MLTAQIASNVTIPPWVRVFHWLNVVAVAVMLMSGLRIYNASPLFDFLFPPWITLGGWLGGALLWHFAAMWLLAVNLLAYLAMNLASRRFFKRFLPLTPASVLRDALSFVRGKLSHDNLAEYNALQKLAYLTAIACLCLLVLSGLAIWKPVQLPLLRDAFGGFDQARVVHFVVMAILAGFIVVHVAMVALVPKTLMRMIKGR